MTTKQMVAKLTRLDARLMKERDELRDIVNEAAEKEECISEAITALEICIDNLRYATE